MARKPQSRVRMGIDMYHFLTTLDTDRLGGPMLAYFTEISIPSMYGYSEGKTRMPPDVAKRVMQAIRLYIKHLEKCHDEIEVKLEELKVEQLEHERKKKYGKTSYND